MSKNANLGGRVKSDALFGPPTSPTGIVRAPARLQEEPDAPFHIHRTSSRSTFSDAVRDIPDALWEPVKYLPNDPNSLQDSVKNHLEYTLARTRFNSDERSCYRAVAHSIRDRLMESWNDTQQHVTEKDAKRVYYLSLEFLIGRAMQNALINIDLQGPYAAALKQMGHDLETLYQKEPDAALGNGGLGRLAACFMDSLATLDYPAWGYGIRYNYGIFQQKIVDGRQVEHPDYWLTFGNPWEIERRDVAYPVRFYGRINRYKDEHGNNVTRWDGGETVMAVAYDNPIPGFDTFNTNNIRLWRALPTSEFDFKSFNDGDYLKAIEARQRAEYISSVLYPNDSTPSGKELRLKQQYFFVAATLQDIVRRFKKRTRSWKDFPEKVAVQLNDTHPAIAIPELMRIFVDEDGLSWDLAWELTQQVFGYTNHTVLPEALEKWSVDLIGHLLPRHLEIIYMINHHFMQDMARRYQGDHERMSRMSIIEEPTDHNPHKLVRMANLACVGSHAVNGVAALHTDLVKKTILKDFAEAWPQKFQNKTNGVTPRRWIHCANPRLSALISRHLGSDRWLTDLTELAHLKDAVTVDLVEEWAAVKHMNKERLASLITRATGVTVSPKAMFDVMVKRLHEYKRQLMNALYCIYRYDKIKRMHPSERTKVVPRVTMFAGKAAPGYAQAKRIIKLINNIADRVNNDPEIGDLFKVVFIPNYCVSAAEIIIPAADLSQHISTAGTEASGTSNMKFAMNGCLVIGTMDGANVEMAEEMGADNMFIFGTRVQDLHGATQRMRNGGDEYLGRLRPILNMISDGQFGDASEMYHIVNALTNGNDHYLLGADFETYILAQERVDRTYQDKDKWMRMSIQGAASMGKFSSDRTIHEYAKDIWGLTQCRLPNPRKNENNLHEAITAPAAESVPLPVTEPHPQLPLTLELQKPLTPEPQEHRKKQKSKASSTPSTSEIDIAALTL